MTAPISHPSEPFPQILGDGSELFQGGFEVLGDFFGDDVRGGGAESSSDSSFNQKMSRLTLSRLSRSGPEMRQNLAPRQSTSKRTLL